MELHAARARLLRNAAGATIQAMDLGGLGNASAGRPGNGGARGIPSCVDACGNGIQSNSGASAAPQQAMPAPPLQQPPLHRGAPPASVGESRVALSKVARADCSCARASAARTSADGDSDVVASDDVDATCDR